MHRVLDLYDHPPADGRVICADEFGPLNWPPAEVIPTECITIHAERPGSSAKQVQVPEAMSFERFSAAVRLREKDAVRKEQHSALMFLAPLIRRLFEVFVGGPGLNKSAKSFGSAYRDARRGR
ncbi:hypothetical protein AB0A63_27715 [Lentzea sp. NPDC042327]|uniref:hypothetical protein n=1 Tax=Lentzea sp. NPDC042327 TaxID=3154801 RepID=UPI0033C8BD54